MLNDDFTYCLGKNCRLRDNCKRFINGISVYDGLHWMANCNEDNREGYIKNK